MPGRSRSSMACRARLDSSRTANRSASCSADANETGIQPMTEREVRPAVADLTAIPAVRCPCGLARRAFADVPGAPASVHRVDISEDARTHYHKAQTETYYVLECEPGAAVELDGEAVPVRPGVAVMIPPG